MMLMSSVGIANRLTPQQVANHEKLTRGEKLGHLQELRAALEERCHHGDIEASDAKPSMTELDQAIEHVRTH